MEDKYKRGWKIVEVEADTIKTLFHGINGTRKMPKRIWLEADEKMVKDGTSKTEYLSGWHILKTRKAALEYLKVFKNRLHLLKVVPILYDDTTLRPKEHSRQPVFLAKQIMFI